MDQLVFRTAAASVELHCIRMSPMPQSNFAEAWCFAISQYQQLHHITGIAMLQPLTH